MTKRPALRLVGNSTDPPRTPPHNNEAEQALLGILLLNNDIYFEIFEIVIAEDFYDPVHGRIYDAIGKTIEVGRVADPRTLRGQFDADEALKSMGGGQYLVDLAASVITSINAEDYAEYIYELATRRRILVFAQEVMELAYDLSAPPKTREQIITIVENKIYAITERRDKDGPRPIAQVWQEKLDQISEAMKGNAGGVKTGLADLDEKIGGLRSGTLYTIAARPAMGKTAMGLTIAINAVIKKSRVTFFTLEVSRTELIERVVARLTGYPPKKQHGQMSIEEFQRIFNHTNETAAWPLHIDDTPALTIAQIRARAIRQKRRFGLDLLVIDYLGLIRPSDRQINRNYQVEEITQGLKNLAKELRVPIILLAQLNRELEKRDDKRPMLSDLRDSGSVEQDSDAVMFIYRHEHYLRRAAPQRYEKESAQHFAEREARWNLEVERSHNKAELIIAKLRQGETGSVPLGYEGWRFHFFDLPGSSATPGDERDAV